MFEAPTAAVAAALHPDTSADTLAALIVTDTTPRRVRRQLDLVRIVGLLLMLGLLGLIGAYANQTTGGANDDLSRLLRTIPTVLFKRGAY